MLDPRLPPNGIDKLQHYTRKFGPAAERMLKDANGPLHQRGRAVGLDFQYHEGSKVFNSMNCHKLITWAYIKHEAATANHLKEVMLRKYFSEGKNLGLKSELLAAVDEAKLPLDEAEKIIDDKAECSDDVNEEFETELADSHRKVSGVPAFYFPDGTTFSGAEQGQVFDRAIARALERTAAK